MTAPGPSGGTSPLRVGGLALLGVGLVAGLIGLATLATNGGDDGEPTAAPAPSATSTAEPSAGSPAPLTPAPGESAPGQPGQPGAPTGEVPVPSFGATPTNGIAAPPTAAPGAPGTAGDGAAAAGAGSGSGSGSGSGGGAEVVKAPVRVYNNSTISGLAARAADDFRNADWPVEQVANYPSGIIPTSTVYYRPGTSEQDAAKVLGDQFGLRVEQRFEGLDEASPGLIVIVTNDYQRRG